MNRASVRPSVKTRPVEHHHHGHPVKRIEFFGGSGTGKSTLYNDLPYNQLQVRSFHSLKALAAIQEARHASPTFSLGYRLVRSNAFLARFMEKKAIRKLDAFFETAYAGDPRALSSLPPIQEGDSLKECHKRREILNYLFWLQYISMLRTESLMIADEGIIMKADEICLQRLPLDGLVGVINVRCDHHHRYERIRQRHNRRTVSGKQWSSIVEFNRRYNIKLERENFKCEYLQSAGVPVLQINTSRPLQLCLKEVACFISELARVR